LVGGSDRIAPKLIEWRGRWRGETPLLLLPRTAQETALVVRICAETGTAVTPQGGGTGLVGGQIPQGEVLLSTERLRAIREVAPGDDAIVVEAGVTLAEVRAAAAAADRFFPLSLASEGTATVGGLLSTNAGGTAVLRYGTMRDMALGLEAVLPNGELWSGLKRLRKDVSGYDLKQLLIGAEGTLGVVTAASLKLFPVLRSRAVAFAGLRSPDAALALLALAKLEGAVEAFELMGRASLGLVLKNIAGARDPLAEPHSWYVLIETATAAADEAEPVLERILSAGFAADLLQDAVLAKSESEARTLWALRENHSAAQKSEGEGWKHDISVPVSRMAEFIERGTALALERAPGANVTAFRPRRRRQCPLRCAAAARCGSGACRGAGRGVARPARPRARSGRQPVGGTRPGRAEVRRSPALQVRDGGRRAARHPNRARPQADHEPARPVLTMAGLHPYIPVHPRRTPDAADRHDRKPDRLGGLRRG
jgi:FAD/FMN-containing dehydrogenase